MSGSLDSDQGFRGLQRLKEKAEQNIQLCQIFTVLDESAKVRKKKDNLAPCFNFLLA